MSTLMPILLSQIVPAGSVVAWAIFIVALAGICALVGLGLRKLGIVLPDFVVQAFWIVVICAVIILAIILLARLTGIG